MGKGDMSKSDSSRIQSSQAKGSNDMSPSGFAARAQSAGDRNTAAMSSAAQQNTGLGSGTKPGGAKN
ncbi:hypothetical protein M426DRAFT_17678 [Hypoxylon sp. CI-4A]|nr:hypothetical protein M426DRAFT_17678 [Hypoxylon sp. CI-4A]